jgi:hypothetical protein
MNAENVRLFEGRKFMWDGVIYDTTVEAQAAQSNCLSAGFETHLVEQDDKYLLYTRRVVTEIKIEGAPQ